MQGGRPSFSRPLRIFVNFAKASGSRQSPPTVSGHTTGTDFQKICPYYTTINRQNQLFFATFSSQIANSSLCTNNSRLFCLFLGTYDNLIFSDGFPLVISFKYPGIPLFDRHAHCGQLYGAAPTPVPAGIYSTRRVPLRLQPKCLHPAFCSLSGFILHLSRPMGAVFALPGGITAPEAGTPSVPGIRRRGTR